MKFIKKFKSKLEKNKPLVISYKIIKCLFSIIVGIMLVLILVQKFSNNNLAIGGIRIFWVASESMKPEYDIGDIIVTKKVDAGDLKVGDNVTYHGEKGQVQDVIVTHKIISSRQSDGKYYFITKGTANETPDPEIKYSQIYGKVEYKTVVLSYISKLMNNVYIYYGMFTVIGVMASYQIVKIVFDKDEDDEDDEEKIDS